MTKLYYSPGACSMAPHIALEELGLPFDTHRVVLAQKENFTPEFLAVNPRARVPALEVDGQIYTEAPALLIYIASLAPEAGLVPPLGSAALARCLEWLGWMSSTHHIAIAQFWRPERFLPEGEPSETFVAQGKRNIQRGNAEIESRIGDGWLLGSTYSIADAYLFPFYRWGNRIGLDMKEDCPRWSGWVERMKERSAVQRVVEREGLSLSEW